jgi:6-phosphogluconolactonase
MIESFASQDALATGAAQACSLALEAGLSARGHASLVGTGGRSPGPVYDRLCQADLDWGRVSVTLSDDRFVPATDPRSNEALLHQRLLIERAAAATFVPLTTSVPTPQIAAEVAEPLVRALSPFDIVLLGMGEDGHIASLIPGSSVLETGLDPKAARFVLEVPEAIGDPPCPRVSLTMAALAPARSILILISGAAKRAVVEDRQGLPIHSLLAQARGAVRVFWTP